MIPLRRLSAPPRPSAVRTGTLRPSASLEIAYANKWEALVKQMHAETVAAVLAEYGGSDATGMDAADDGPKLSFWDRLLAKLTGKFEKAAGGLATGMIKRLDTDAKNGLERSLREVSEAFTLKYRNPGDVQAVIDKRIDENVHYIKLIPEKYLDGVRKSVSASIEQGNGLQDLLPAMEERYGEAKRHARNVALDQTRKAYTAINTARMKDSGIKQFEWVHSGGSQEPRRLHQKSASSGGLNGGIYDLDNPPVIDEKTGERGLPGHAINCRCTMRPIVTFDFGDDDDE